MKFSFRNRVAGVVGNFLEHYDNALFGLLAPFIAPLFFANTDPVTGLIYTYGMLPLGFFTRPLGALFFGVIGDRFGRRQALISSLFGMAVVTIGMGCLPVYQDVGLFAPVLLAVGRMLQSFCAAGELAGGAIFVLEHTPPIKRGFASGCYDASTVGGILLASALVTWMSARGQIDTEWRVLFWFGGMTAILGLILRWMTIDEPKLDGSEPAIRGLLPLKNYSRALVAIIFASGFGYTTYSLAFTLMTGYIPLITSFSKADVMQLNTVLLMLDLCLLPLFGYLSMKIGKERQMVMAALASAVVAIPLFSMLDGASLGLVVGVRCAIVLLGVTFAAPYYAWAIEQVPVKHRYLLLSFGGALGSQLIGMPTSAVCLWLYKMVGWSGVPGIYLMCVGLAAAAIVVWQKKN